MTIVDAQKRVLKLWPGYSPKTYDSHFVLGLSEWFEDHLSGGVVAADCHFSSVKKVVKDPIFITPVPNRKRKLADLEDADVDETNDDLLPVPPPSKKNEKHNKDLHAARARVEHPYADIKKMFNALAHPWPGDLKQLQYLVFYSVAVHNMQFH